jgi:type III secretory pathway component EscT
VPELLTWLGGAAAVERALAVGLLVAVRIAPLAIIAPWVALRATPTVVRGAVTVVIAVALTPIALHHAPAPPPGAPALLAAALRELVVGLTFAIAVALPFFAVGWAGQLTDTWRGATLSEVIAPFSGEPVSALGNLYLMTAVVLFFAFGGHLVAIDAFAATLHTVPVGFSIDADSLFGVAFGSARLFAAALALSAAVAAPVAAVLVLTDLSLGLLGRAAPQLPLFFAAMPLRAALGLGVAMLTVSLLVSALPDLFIAAVDRAASLLDRLSP